MGAGEDGHGDGGFPPVSSHAALASSLTPVCSGSPTKSSSPLYPTPSDAILKPLRISKVKRLAMSRVVLGGAPGS
jgi:hypothetical protein